MIDYSLALIPPELAYYWIALGIEILGIFVAFAISRYGYKAYKIIGEQKYKYFFYGFLFTGLNFTFHVIINLLWKLGDVAWFIKKQYQMYIGPVLGLYYIFLIGALFAYISLAIVYADVSRKNIGLFYFWALILGALSFTDYIDFNVLASIPLSFVAFLGFEKYKESKNPYQLLTSLAFGCLFLFHALVVLEQVNTIFYSIRYSVLMAGLMMLLVTFFKINYGRKKK